MAFKATDKPIKARLKKQTKNYPINSKMAKKAFFSGLTAF